MPSKHGGLGSKWHAAIMGSCNYICQSETHSPLCDGMAIEAHHCVYRSHLTAPALWIIENGIALSKPCHMLAHASHNASIDQARLDRAVRAVNKIQGNDPSHPEFKIQPFWKKGLNTL